MFHICGFNVLHVMQMRSSDENSVCLSVKRMLRGKMEENLSSFLYRTKII